VTPEERLELIYKAALEANAKQEELTGLLASIMWIAGDLSGPSAFSKEEIESLVKDKEALRYRKREKNL
jgi:hypothetical protein